MYSETNTPGSGDDPHSSAQLFPYSANRHNVTSFTREIGTSYLVDNSEKLKVREPLENGNGVKLHCEMRQNQKGHQAGLFTLHAGLHHFHLEASLHTRRVPPSCLS